MPASRSRQLARTPDIGHKREDLTRFPLPFFPVGAYLVIYRAIFRRPVEIVAVTQGSRDIPFSYSGDSANE